MCGIAESNGFRIVPEERLRGARPAVEAVFADAIVTDTDGGYNCHRPALVLRKDSMRARLPVLTCARFLRGSVNYSLYPLSSPHRRLAKRAERPTTFWRGRRSFSAAIKSG